MSQDKDLGRLMGNEKAVLREIQKNNQVNVNNMFSPKNSISQKNIHIPYQSFAEADAESEDPATKAKAAEIIKNHKKKEALKDAFYRSLWKQKHGNHSITAQRHPTVD